LESQIKFYQQPGDAKKPYLAQYSAVVSDEAPVDASNTILKNNIPIKNRLKPLKTNFNAFLTEFFLLIGKYIFNR
jgi:hypothetical protein